MVAGLLAAISLLAASCPNSGNNSNPAQTAAAGSPTASSTPAQAGGTVVPEPATNPAFTGADFSFMTFDGAGHRLSDYAGKPVVVNFFGVT